MSSHIRFRFLLFQLAAISIATPQSSAEELQAELCAERVRQFVGSMDRVLSNNPGHTLTFYQGMMANLPAKGCNVHEVIAISATSRFFVEAYEAYAYYVIVFKSKTVKFSFGLQKDTGVIDYPAAGWLEESL